MDERPSDYTGRPARRVTELTPQELFAADQEAAMVDEHLNGLVGILVHTIQFLGGESPSHERVPSLFLERMETYSDQQVRVLLQAACWYLAEVNQGRRK